MKILIALSITLLFIGCQNERADINDKTLAFTKKVVDRQLKSIIERTESNYEEKWSCELIAEKSHHFEIIEALKKVSISFEKVDQNLEAFNSILSTFTYIDSLILLDARYLGLSKDDAKQMRLNPPVIALDENNSEAAALSRIEYIYAYAIEIASRGLASNFRPCLVFTQYYAVFDLHQHDDKDSVFISIDINEAVCPPFFAEVSIEGRNPIILSRLDRTQVAVHKDFVRRKKISWKIKVQNNQNGVTSLNNGEWTPVVAWF